MTMSVHETLKAMRELLSDEKRWTQGANAKDAMGRRVHECGCYATKWCLAGAYTKIAGGMAFDDYRDFWRALCGDEGSAVDFNDTHTHAEVIAKLDDAIKATENA